MRQFIALAASLWLASNSLPALATPEHPTIREAEATVKRAAAHIEKVGRETAFADFSRNPGPFIDHDLYVVVYDMGAKVLAHVNPKMIGKNIMDLRDSDGLTFVKERIETARSKSQGYQDVKLFDPAARRIETKRVYWERHGDLLISASGFSK